MIQAVNKLCKVYIQLIHLHISLSENKPLFFFLFLITQTAFHALEESTKLLLLGYFKLVKAV